MSEKFYCKCCGASNSSISGLTASRCYKNPEGKYHVLYEGGEKSKYVCKYCGVSNLTLSGLVSSRCYKSPEGKYHVPL